MTRSLASRIRARLRGEGPSRSLGVGQVSIGAHSYGFESILTWQTTDIVIVGRYSSAAPGVVLVGGGNHPTGVGTFPFRSRLIGRRWYPEDGTSRGPLVIGNDVWLGQGAMVMSGVTIGHGSIVAAGAVVTRDFPPYSLVGGNPATLIRPRFDDATVEQLLRIGWWDWPDEKVVSCIDDFYGDIGAFLDKHG